MSDAHIANGSIRVAVLFANIAGVSAYQQGRSIPWRRVGLLLPPVLIGSGLGAWTATRVSPEGMQRVFAVVLLLVALSVIFNTNRWLEDLPPRLSPFWRNIVFLFIGFYGGFVQIGVGILLLTALVLGSGLDLLKGNGAKVALIGTYTLVALPFYFVAGRVRAGGRVHVGCLPGGAAGGSQGSGLGEVGAGGGSGRGGDPDDDRLTTAGKAPSRIVHRPAGGTPGGCADRWLTRRNIESDG